MADADAEDAPHVDRIEIDREPRPGEGLEAVVGQDEEAWANRTAEERLSAAGAARAAQDRVQAAGTGADAQGANGGPGLGVLFNPKNYPWTEDKECNAVSYTHLTLPTTPYV